MNTRELDAYLAKFEGKKHQAKRHDIREIRVILEDLFLKEANDPQTYTSMVMNAQRRAKRVKK